MVITAIKYSAMRVEHASVAGVLRMNGDTHRCRAAQRASKAL